MNLEAYNVHKRATLDRLSGKYTARMKEVMRRHAQGIAADLLEHLNADKGSFKPDLKDFQKKAEALFEEHQEETEAVAIADGLREVSPDQELNSWENFPLNAPIEQTLSVELASIRDRIVERFRKQKKKSLSDRLRDLLRSQSTNYLDNLRKAYKILADDWLEGKSTVRDTKKILAEALRVSAHHAEVIFRTETTSHFNEARREYFKADTVVDYMQLFAITDGRISNICESRHEYVIPIADAGKKKYMPAFHPNCRTIQRPLISGLTSHKRLIEKGLKMDERKFVPLPRGWG